MKNRKNTWIPAARPEWVKRINQEGRYMDIQSVVPLDENSLLETAKENTGLNDFGEDFYEPFQILVKSLDEESELNLMGRIMTRSNLLVFLESRLQVEETFKKHPEILEQEIDQPVMILGQGRSGTSMLHNLLAQDTANGVIKFWETYFPCPPPEKASYLTNLRIEKADKLVTQVYRVTPECKSIHAFGAKLPTENVDLHCLSFKSPFFTVLGGQAPSYMAYLQQQDMVPIYQYEKKLLQLLQWKNPRKRWVLKSPYSMMHIPQMLEVYPDMRFIWSHRDPVKSLSSMTDLLGTLFWSRSDQPFIGDSFDMYINADLSAMLLNQPIDLLESGVLPKERLYNVLFKDFIKDPLNTAADIYDYLQMNFTDAAQQAMKEFITQQSEVEKFKHHYDTGTQVQVAIERKAYARYQQYFDVPNEI